MITECEMSKKLNRFTYGETLAENVSDAQIQRQDNTGNSFKTITSTISIFFLRLCCMCRASLR